MSDPEVERFRCFVREFFQREAPAQRVASWRAAGQVERAFWESAGAAGLLGVMAPAAYGGAAGDFRHEVVLIEEAKRQGVDGFAIGLHNVIVLPYILAHGDEAQRRRWTPGLVAGRSIAAIAMSEPSAGSDLKSITTSAVKDGDGYRINGVKTFISNGQIANFIVVAAKTDPQKGAKGISLFIVETEKVSGFSRGKTLRKIGNDAQDTSELFFNDVAVPHENLLGAEEGRGFAQLMAELPRERLIIAVGGVAAMEAALALTLAHVEERQVAGERLIDLQSTQFKLAECKAHLELARAYVARCIDKVLCGRLDDESSAIAKYWVTDAECRVIDICQQLHGGCGYLEDSAIARMSCDSRFQRVYGGSNEVMKMLIARSLRSERAGVP